MNPRFLRAFEVALAYELDRRVLVELLRAGREVRYEELRRAVSEDSSQTFRNTVDRLMRHACIRRRLEPHGKRYRSYLSPSAQGLTIASILDTLGRDGALPEDLPPDVRADVQRAFLGLPVDSVTA